MNHQERVSNWLRIGQTNLPTKPQFPNTDKFRLGLSLMLEELTELAESGTDDDMRFFAELLSNAGTKMWKKAAQLVDSEGGKDRNFTEFRDALADSEVVHSNMVAFSGMEKQFQEDFDNVMTSNESKYEDSEVEASETCKKYQADGYSCNYKLVVSTNKEGIPEQRFIIYSTSPDNYGKILKGGKYHPPILRTVSEEEFHDRYRPIKNHLDENEHGLYDGFGFETNGKELDFVENYAVTNIATILEKDEKWYLVAGKHTVDRVGYVLTEEPIFEENLEILID